MDEDLDAQLVLALLGATQALSTALEDSLRRFDLGLADFEVLYRVAEAGRGKDGGVKMQTLAEEGLLTQSGLTRLLDRLERRGLIERRPSATDQRAKLCVLTPAGAKLYREADPPFCERLTEELHGRAKLSKKDLAQLVALLGRLIPPRAPRE
jgi:DNA-binding MarR family transcriptional regulator